MSINYNNILQNVIKNQGEIEDLQPLAGKQVFVFPFTIVSGIVNYTENGEKSSIWNPDDFTNFFSVLTGKETVTAVWDNSTFAEADELTAENPLNGLAATYQVGTHYNAYVDNVSSGTEISGLKGLDNFLSLKPQQTITLSFGSDSQFWQQQFSETETNTTNQVWNPTTRDLIKLYIIPELDANQWLYISNVDKYYDNNDNLIRTTVTFSSVSDNLSNTSGVRVSLVQPSASGEEYAWPKITIDEETKQRKIELDLNRLQPKPVTSTQVKFDGVAGLHTLVCFGRPVYRKQLYPILDEDGKFRKRIEPPRLLLPYRTLPAVNENLSWQSAPIDNFYFAARAQSTYHEFWSDWKEKIKQNYDPLAKTNFEGILLCASNDEEKSEINATNPIQGQSKYINSIKDNPAIQPVKKNLTFYTQATAACEKSITLYNNRTYTYGELLCHNYFISQPMTTLPQGKNSTTTWSYNALPIVGGFLNKCLAGANLGFQTNQTKIPTPATPVFIPCDVFNIYQDAFGGTKFKYALPYDAFRYGQSDQLTAMMGIGNFNTTFRVQLTDKYQNGSEITNTLYLGQNKLPNGETLPENKIKYWNENCKPYHELPNSEDMDEVIGYYIDTQYCKAIYSGNYTWSLFSNLYANQKPEYVSDFKLITKSQMINSIREWTNIYNTCFWKDGFNTSGNANWPTQLNFPLSSQDIKSDVLIDDDNQVNVLNQGKYIFKAQDVYDAVNVSGDTSQWIMNRFQKGVIWESGKGLYLPKYRTEGWISAGTKKETLNEWTTEGSNVCHERKLTPDNSTLSIDLISTINKSINQDQKIFNMGDLSKQFKKVIITIKVQNSKMNESMSSDISSNSGTWKTDIVLTLDEILKLNNSHKEIDAKFWYWSGASQNCWYDYNVVTASRYNRGTLTLARVNDIKFDDSRLTFNVERLVQINRGKGSVWTDYKQYVSDGDAQLMIDKIMYVK